MRKENEIVAELSSFGSACSTMRKHVFSNGNWMYLFNLRSSAFGSQLAFFQVHCVIDLGVKIAEWLIKEGEVTGQFRDELKRSFPRLLRDCADDFERKLP